MRLKKIWLAVIFLLGAFTAPLSGQEVQDSSVTKIVLNDGTILYGKIIAESDSIVTFLTSSGLQNSLPARIITKRENIRRSYYAAELKGEDPNTSRLFFAPTGRTLGGRSGYFSVVELFFPTIAFGITDDFIFAGGCSIFPGDVQQIYYLMPKYRIYSNGRTDVSSGVLYVSAVEEKFGIVYAVGSTGTEAFSFTGGMGYGFNDAGILDSPFIMAGFDARISSQAKIISENWFIPGLKGMLLSFGVRFYGTHLAADFGLITIASSESQDMGFVPWLGFAYNF